MKQHPAALLPEPLRPPVENCTIMSGHMLAHALEESAELLGIGCRGAVVVAHVNVHERGAGFIGGVRRLDLLQTVIGTAGLSCLVGTEPVIATVMMHGLAMTRPPPIALRAF